MGFISNATAHSMENVVENVVETVAVRGLFCEGGDVNLDGHVSLVVINLEKMVW